MCKFLPVLSPFVGLTTAVSHAEQTKPGFVDKNNLLLSSGMFRLYCIILSMQQHLK